jgi:hypothetical protein
MAKALAGLPVGQLAINRLTGEPANCLTKFKEADFGY